MIQRFEQLEDALNRLENIIVGMKQENEKLTHDVCELKGVIDDRDLEIMQLQEDAQKKTEERGAEKSEIENRLEGLLGRVRALAPEDKN